MWVLPPPPVLHFPWITGLTPRTDLIWELCVHIWGVGEGRQLEKFNLPALQELELPIQTSLHSSCNQIVFFFSFPDNATNIILHVGVCLLFWDHINITHLTICNVLKPTCLTISPSGIFLSTDVFIDKDSPWTWPLRCSICRVWAGGARR